MSSRRKRRIRPQQLPPRKRLLSEAEVETREETVEKSEVPESKPVHYTQAPTRRVTDDEMCEIILKIVDYFTQQGFVEPSDTHIQNLMKLPRTMGTCFNVAGYVRDDKLGDYYTVTFGNRKKWHPMQKVIQFPLCRQDAKYISLIIRTCYLCIEPDKHI